MMARWIAAGVVAVLLCAVPVTPAAAAPGPPGHAEWWFDTWHIQHLWAEGARGQGITIGEIDTGVNIVPALAGHVLTGTNRGPAGGVGDVDRDTSVLGHGTAMASLMVAHANPANILGIAPDARVLPVAVPLEETTDFEGGFADLDLAGAINYAAEHGAKIISMSLGQQSDGDAHSLSCPSDDQQAIDHALSKGAIVVAAGGNDGQNGSPIEDPAVCLGVVAVAAVNSAGRVAAFSSRHPYVAVAAPGVDVSTLTKDPEFEAVGTMGTSASTALTSAGLAMIWSKYPKLTNRQVVARLLATLRGKRAKADAAYGYGTVDIAAAIDRTVPADAPNPVFAADDPFLARERQQSAPPPPPSIRLGRQPPDGPPLVVAAPAGPLAGPGLAGLVTGAVGLVAIVLLVAFAVAGRRRRVRAIRGFSSSVHPPGGLSAR